MIETICCLTLLFVGLVVEKEGVLIAAAMFAIAANLNNSK